MFKYLELSIFKIFLIKGSANQKYTGLPVLSIPRKTIDTLLKRKRV